MERTVAETILDSLAYWGIQNIYGVSGDAVLPFMDALGKQDKIKYYSTVSEQGASFMACGEARVTGRPGVCLSTEGPGALNLVNGVADAYRDGVPMLVFTGQVETGKLFTGARQYFDQQQLFAPITGLTTLLTRPESVVAALRVAMEKAAGDSTPCHISIPKDIFLSPAHCHVPALGTPRPPGISGSVEDVLSVIAGCRRPLILAGKDALLHQEAVIKLADRIGAGIVATQEAGGICSTASRLMPGGLGEAHIPPLLDRADCILLIGSSPYEHKFIPPGVRVVQIDTCPQKLSRQLRPIPLTGDVADILGSLLGGLPGAEPDITWQEEIKRSRGAHLSMIREEAHLSGSPVSPRKTVALLNDIIPEDAIISIDTGEFMHWFDRGFTSRRQQVIISGYWRCMGGGLPMGLGARVSAPGKKVVVLTGEGGFIMTMQEIITAVRYSLPVTVIIFNNGRYLLEEHRMEKAGMIPFGVDVRAPDFAALATACGAGGTRVEESEKLRETLVKAIEADRPWVVDIQTAAERPLFI